jgi:hypothetical protein
MEGFAETASPVRVARVGLELFSGAIADRIPAGIDLRPERAPDVSYA